MSTNEITSKLHRQFYCKKCDFNCGKTGDWNRHIVTARHVRRTNTIKITSDHNMHTCICGNEYKHMSSLWNHKKTIYKVFLYAIVKNHGQ